MTIHEMSNKKNGFKLTTKQGKIIDFSILFGILFYGLIIHDSMEIYYQILFDTFIKIETFVMLSGIIMMIIGYIFGERIQSNTKWEMNLIIKEACQSSICVFVVSGLATFIRMKINSNGLHSVALTYDINIATLGLYNKGYYIFSYLYLFIETIIIWISADGWTYFKHKCLHSRTLFVWHKDHHEFKDPTSFAGFAISPLESLWTFSPMLLFLYPNIIGYTYAPLQLNMIWAFVILNLYLHCGYTLKYIEIILPNIYLNTSAYHNIHHEKTTTNYGEVSPFWDYIFKTYDQSRYIQDKQKFGWIFYDFS